MPKTQDSYNSYRDKMESLDKEYQEITKRLKEIDEERRSLILESYSVNYVDKYLRIDNACNTTWLYVKSQTVNGELSHPTVILSGEGFNEYMKSCDIRFSNNETYVLYLDRLGKDRKWRVTNGNIQEISKEIFNEALEKKIMNVKKSYCLQV